MPGSALANHVERSTRVPNRPRCRTASHPTGSASSTVTAAATTPRMTVRTSVEVSRAVSTVAVVSSSSQCTRMPSGTSRVVAARVARAAVSGSRARVRRGRAGRAVPPPTRAWRPRPRRPCSVTSSSRQASSSTDASAVAAGPANEERYWS